MANEAKVDKYKGECDEKNPSYTLYEYNQTEIKQTRITSP